jgi:hypothetical protein
MELRKRKVKQVISVYAMKAYRGSRVVAPLILNWALDGVEWSASRHGRYTPDKGPHGTQLRGDWVGFTAGLDVLQHKLILNYLKSGITALCTASFLFALVQFRIGKFLFRKK